MTRPPRIAILPCLAGGAFLWWTLGGWEGFVSGVLAGVGFWFVVGLWLEAD